MYVEPNMVANCVASGLTVHVLIEKHALFENLQ